MDEEFAHCGREQISQRLVLSPEGGVQNAVVFLEGDFPAAAPPQAAVILAQRGCQFVPHVLLLPKGAPFLITNEDPMAHDVRAFAGPKILFRFEMEEGARAVEKRFEEAGRIAVRCGLHKWMHAIVVSTEHPHYALTDGEGRFRLEGLPAGDFQVKVWHEVLGELAEPVQVSEDAVTAVDLSWPA